MATNEERLKQPVSPGTLWFSVFAGPVAWTLRLLISYPLVPVVCARDWGILLHLISVGFFLLGLAGALVAWRNVGKVRALDERTTHQWVLERTRFMAYLGLLASGLFTLVIFTEWIPVFFTDPCLSR
jgi:hypothetical protein